MSFFAKLRRNSTIADRYANKSPYHSPSNSGRRHHRHERQPYYPGWPVPLSFESIPYLPSESAPGASSEVSLRSEYSHLDTDTSRYPKFSASAGGAPQSTTHRRSVDTHNEYETTAEGRTTESQIDPMLTVGSLSMAWDVRKSPEQIRQYRSSRQSSDLMAPALSPQSQYLCIVSHDFPWTIAISTNDGRPLTIIDVLEALYASLGKEVRRSEWALASDVHKYNMLKANKGRRHSEVAMRIRRVDWLGTMCMFAGLERDEDLVRQRMMPGDHPGEVWAVRFGLL